MLGRTAHVEHHVQLAYCGASSPRLCGVSLWLWQAAKYVVSSVAQSSEELASVRLHRLVLEVVALLASVGMEARQKIVAAPPHIVLLADGKHQLAIDVCVLRCKLLLRSPAERPAPNAKARGGVVLQI